jgi:four helix bundle protein
MNSFRELKVWQEAHNLTLKIYELTRDFPQEEKFRLINQLCSSSASIPANIAEGTGRKTLKEYVQFLYNARGSLEETKYHLILAKDLGYIPIEEYEILQSRYNETGKMLNGLITSLKLKGEEEDG